MALVPDQGPIQEFVAAGLHPALHDGVHPRHADAREHDFDSGVAQDLVEERRELRIPVAHQVAAGGSGILNVHDEVPGGLAHSVSSGMHCSAQDADTAGGVLDDREDVLPLAGQGEGLDEVARKKRSGVESQEVGTGGGAAVGRGGEALGLENLPYGGGSDLDAEGGELTVHAPVPTRRVLPHQAQDQNADRADRGRATWSLRPAGAGVTLLHQVAMPAQHGVRSDQQPQATPDRARQRGEERREESPARRSEPHPALTELPLKDGELMTQGEDLHILSRVAQRQRPRGREHIGDSQLCQAKKHD